jgi:hypothetical protein
MPGTSDRIRHEMDVKRSPKDKGWILTIEVGVYDNYMITVNGTPINASPEYDQGQGWTGASLIIAQQLHEFREQVKRTTRERDRDV